MDVREDNEEEDDEDEDASGVEYYRRNARIDRALSQSMFLMHAEMLDLETYLFHVEGTTGNEYVVTLSNDTVSCTCPDFLERGYRCKHIYFLLYRALGFPSRVHPPRASIVNRAKQFFLQRSGASDSSGNQPRKEKNADRVQTRPYIGQPCAVCLEDLTKESTVFTCTTSCGNSIHSACFDHWRTKNQTCVFCRAPFPADLNE